MTKPNYNDTTYDIPTDWAESNQNEIERPLSGKITSGWVNAEEPSHRYFNWFWRHTGKWLSYLDSKIDEIIANTPEPLYVPLGGIIEYSGESLPSDKWDWADGGELSRTTYNTLFAVTGTRFGVGDGSTTFNKPNRNGRVGVGYDVSQLEFNTTGKLGGNKTITLTNDQIPVHNHEITKSSHTHSTNDPGHNHSVNMGVTGIDIGNNNWANYGVKSGTTNTSSSQTGITLNPSDIDISLADSGGSQAHSNLQPYITFRYIIRVK